jgi:predicted nucleic acid-binding Zn ribbon protein
MRNTSDLCVECSRRIPAGAPVAIVREWVPTGSVVRLTGHRVVKRRDVLVCLDCAQTNHKTENSFAETGHCENCGREIRHWDLSQRLPSACSVECRLLAANKRSRERRRVEHETIACVQCGESFTPERDDAKTCSNRCRQKLYRETLRTKRGASRALDDLTKEEGKP